ncbi:phage N-6-adenine-methyltransferase [Falsiroseomonas tokyonensis]|uniref:Phage N-6-adenine-methyltransferase n=1 Tax=Falsiroseomonas tokyonensis TaxID=430521 RepID=A0ABV7BX76_9PROT|nr:phage N-6-adenine-methyltransferase [Falsiroseomonas tokyonensis]MBU8540222.1 hypothetical protein [Falsiroseomonas tokyonensis]
MTTDLLGNGTKRGMGGHHSHASDTTVWLTPPELLASLGAFDLDPCAAPEPRPWPTAAVHYGLAENGLMRPWAGRVWLNPPYGAVVSAPFMRRMVEHGRGTALIFARTETALFRETVWRAASALLFLAGRLYFHRPNGDRAEANAGAPSVLVAYGAEDAAHLRDCGLPGAFVHGWRA